MRRQPCPAVTKPELQRDRAARSGVQAARHAFGRVGPTCCRKGVPWLALVLPCGQGNLLAVQEIRACSQRASSRFVYLRLRKFPIRLVTPTATTPKSEPVHQLANNKATHQQLPAHLLDWTANQMHTDSVANDRPGPATAAGGSRQLTTFFLVAYGINRGVARKKRRRHR
jgi:hypothetical protein